jgi:hypothetical protein
LIRLPQRPVRTSENSRETCPRCAPREPRTRTGALLRRWLHCEQTTGKKYFHINGRLVPSFVPRVVRHVSGRPFSHRSHAVVRPLTRPPGSLLHAALLSRLNGRFRMSINQFYSWNHSICRFCASTGFVLPMKFERPLIPVHALHM